MNPEDLHMAKRGRPPSLDEAKCNEILTILSVGGTRQLAAAYVGCSVRTIQNTAERCPEFGDMLRKRERSFEVAFLDNIRAAAKEPRYWRAAAWALERLIPERYARRSPDVITLEQIGYLMTQLAEIISEEVPEKFRKNVLKRLEAIFSDLGHTPNRKEEPA